MANQYLKGLGTRQTPQSEPIPGEPQVENSAGGFAYELTDLDRLRRFLILGSEGGTYYTGERELTKENADTVRRVLDASPSEALRTIEQVSVEGRAPKQGPILFALAVAAAHKDPSVRRVALEDVFPRVVRTGTHLFQFLELVQEHRGWGRSLRRAVAAWYTGKATDALGYQLAKYRQREGWTHWDALRLSHAIQDDPARYPLYKFAQDPQALEDLPAFEEPDAIAAFRDLQKAETPKDSARVISLFGGAASREMVKSEHLGTAEVQEALFDAGMPATALMRNLGNLTRLGVLKPLSERAEVAAGLLTDVERLKRARVHPLTVLQALKTYEAGHGFRGAGTWDPVPEIVQALDQAFYAAFKAVEPAGKRFLLGLDVSGSMGGGVIAGTNIVPSEATAAMSLVTVATEPKTYVLGFADEFRDLGIRKGMTLREARERTLDNNFGRTDCALPMLHALEKGLDVDAFVVYTDNETWAGNIHPVQALRQYRDRTGIPARLVVVGMTATKFTIADPSDAGMLDVVGFDTAAPAIISNFAAGR